MRRLLVGWLAAGVLCLVPNLGWAAAISITDTQPMLDYSGYLPSALPFGLFDYTGQGQMTTLTGIEVTLTMADGDTMPGTGFDYDNLSLGLDSVSTGILLNGFSDCCESTLTFSLFAGDAGWLSDTAAATLLSDLYSDNQLFASILDTTPGDNNVGLYSANAATVTLYGLTDPSPGPTVPEPASLLVWALGAGGLLYGRHRRRLTGSES